MSCYRPLPSQYRDDGTVAVRPWSRDRPAGPEEFEVPCGKCIGCKVDRARAWSIRIGHEAQSWSGSVVVSLDYRPEDLKSWSLQYGDFQKFVRDVRDEVGGIDSQVKRVRVKRKGEYVWQDAVVRPVRYFVAGEYGEETKRPHFHAVMFNLWFKDSVQLQNGYFASRVAEEIWGKGRVVLDRVSGKAAAYVAGYVHSKKFGAAGREYYEDLVDPNTGEVSSRVAPFVAMSRRPGIGSTFYDRFGRDLFPHDFAVQEGRKYKVPRFYYLKYQLEDPGGAERVASARYERALEKPEESSVERRLVREQVAEAKYKFYNSRRM